VYGPILITDQRFITYVDGAERRDGPLGAIVLAAAGVKLGAFAGQLEISPKGAVKLKNDVIFCNRTIKEVAHEFTGYIKNSPWAKLLAILDDSKIRSHLFSKIERVEVQESKFRPHKAQVAVWHHIVYIRFIIKKTGLFHPKSVYVFYLLDGEQVLQIIKRNPIFAGIEVTYESKLQK
jgi:hypothetical protein